MSRPKFALRSLVTWKDKIARLSDDNLRRFYVDLLIRDGRKSQFSITSIIHDDDIPEIIKELEVKFGMNCWINFDSLFVDIFICGTVVTILPWSGRHGEASVEAMMRALLRGENYPLTVYGEIKNWMLPYLLTSLYLTPTNHSWLRSFMEKL